MHAVGYEEIDVRHGPRAGRLASQEPRTSFQHQNPHPQLGGDWRDFGDLLHHRNGIAERTARLSLRVGRCRRQLFSHCTNPTSSVVEPRRAPFEREHMLPHRRRHVSGPVGYGFSHRCVGDDRSHEIVHRSGICRTSDPSANDSVV